MSRVERLEAQEAAIKEEKKLAHIEDAFVSKKQAGTVTMDDKLKLREARQSVRDNHRVPKTGAQPAAIGATAGPEEV